MIAEHFKLHWRRLFAGRGIWVVAFCLVAPALLLAWIESRARLDDEREFLFASSAALFVIYGVGVPALTSLLYGTSILAGEIQNQTLTYLFTRPAPRWQVVVGKYLANVCLVGGITLSSLVVGWLVFGRPLTASLLAVSSAVVATAVAYNAVFALTGSLFTRRAMVAGLIYLASSEIALAWVPSFARNFTIHYHARCIALQVSGLTTELPADAVSVIGDSTIGVSALALAGIAIACLTVTCHLTTRREFALTDNP